MILHRKVRVTSAPIDPSPPSELKRLLLLGSALYLLLALVSYSPNDPSWTTWSTQNQFQNWMGRAGSGLADLLFQLIGLSSFCVVALFGSAAIRPAKPGS